MATGDSLQFICLASLGLLFVSALGITLNRRYSQLAQWRTLAQRQALAYAVTGWLGKVKVLPQRVDGLVVTAFGFVRNGVRTMSLRQPGTDVGLDVDGRGAGQH